MDLDIFYDFFFPAMPTVYISHGSKPRREVQVLCSSVDEIKTRQLDIPKHVIRRNYN